MPSIAIVTFGCQMNKLDSQILRGELSRAGFLLAEEPEQADIVLYNTCSVRAHAEDKVWSHLGAWRRRAEAEPDFVLGVIGCMAQRVSAEIVRRFPYVKLVCGTRAFTRAPDYLKRILEGEGPIVDVAEDTDVVFDRAPEQRATPHSAFVSIMRGCDNFCTYCVVPYVRGRETSRPANEILIEAQALVARGVREITLLGQNVNSYRSDTEQLPDLLARLNALDGLLRVRFVTSHPRDMSDAILDAVAALDKVCPHLHVPAQSGSDRILAAMNRRYTSDDYRRLAERARSRIPDVALASDFIVGFPGETDGDFQDTLALLEEMRYQQAFIFKYSPRPGSRSADWPDDVPDAVKRERNQVLLAAQRAEVVGTEVEVLVDGDSKKDSANMSGRTPQNDIVVFPSGDVETGTLLRLRITGSTPLTLFGKFLRSASV